jgi:hypothetical protein
MLTAGRDYLFFEKADCSKQSLTATMTRGAVVMTPNLIAIIPVQSTGSLLVATVTTRYGGGSDPVATVRALLADPAMDVATLEATLTSMYQDASTRWVFPISQLETFKITTGFFGMASLKMQGESVRRLVIRDKGGKAAAKSFYAGALGARS